MNKDLRHGQLRKHAIFNNMKKYFLIVFGVLTILFIFYIVLSSLKKKAVNKPSGIPTPTNTPINYPLPSGVKQDRSGKITIQGVEVNNFFSSSEKIDPQGDRELSQSNKYSIQYFPQFNSFLISLNASPFEEVRSEAEQDFIKKLGLDEKTACKLPVNIATSQKANPGFAGRNYPLSFCPPY